MQQQIGLMEQQILAEREVLSSLFHDDGFRKAYKVMPELFAVGKHRAVAEALARKPELSDDGLVLELRRVEKLKLFEGPDEVYGILHGTPAARDPWQSATRMRELGSLRGLRDALRGVLADVESGEQGYEDAVGIITHALRQSATARGALTVRELLSLALDRATGKREPALTTGVELLDKVTGGIEKEYGWLLAADTNWGKTSFVCAVAEANLRKRRRVLIVSPEDSPTLYGQKFLQLRTHVNAHRLARGNPTLEELRLLTHEVANASDDPVYLDARGVPVERVAAEIQSYVLGEGIDLVIVDYIQAMFAQKHQQDRRNELAYIGRTITAATKVAGAALLVASQVTIKDGKKNPDRNDVRDCRDIVNAAEVVCIGYYEADEDSPGRGQRKLLIDKAKDAPNPCCLDLDWSDEAACFRLPQEDDEYAEFDYYAERG